MWWDYLGLVISLSDWRSKRDPTWPLERGRAPGKRALIISFCIYRHQPYSLSKLTFKIVLIQNREKTTKWLCETEQCFLWLKKTPKAFICWKNNEICSKSLIILCKPRERERERDKKNLWTCPIALRALRRDRGMCAPEFPPLLLSWQYRWLSADKFVSIAVRSLKNPGRDCGIFNLSSRQRSVC